jgi:type I restriction enzyme S subunit
LQKQEVRKGYKLVEYNYGKFEEIPEEWNSDRLRNVTIFIKDGTHTPPKRVSTGVPLLSARNVVNGTLTRFEDDTYITEDDYRKIHAKYEIQEDDVLLTIVGSIGNSLVVNTNYRFTVQRSVSIIRPNQDKVISYFLHYMFQSNRFKQQLRNYTKATTQPGIYLKELNELVITLPSIYEQQKIASILSNVDSLINQTEREIELTQKLKKGLMQKLLTKGIGHKKFKKVESLYGNLVEIPEDWFKVTIIAVAEITDGSHFSPKKVELGYPLATVQNMKDGRIDIDSCYKISESDYNRLVKDGDRVDLGDVLFSKDGTIGKSLVYRQTDELVVLSSIAILRPFENMDSDYLNYVLQSDYVKNQIASSKTGTALKRVILRDLSKLSILQPPIAEQQKIASILSKIDSQIQEQRKHRDSLQDLKKGLMQKLLTGQIRVNTAVA